MFLRVWQLGDSSFVCMPVCWKFVAGLAVDSARSWELLEFFGCCIDLPRWGRSS